MWPLPRRTLPAPERCGHARVQATSLPVLTLIVALALALVGAAIIAPVVAMELWKAGFRFPFPRILDRTVMLTLLMALLVLARRLKIVELLRQGFGGPESAMSDALSGLVLAGATMGVLFALAALAGTDIHGSAIAHSLLRYFPAAVLIAVMEEAFFRAFLLGGLKHDLGSVGALLASSAVYAILHVIRSPAHFYMTDFEPWVGAETLAAYANRVVHADAGPILFGFLLLGVVLGEAFLFTRGAYASIGLHAGFVLGAKTWRVAAVGAVPQWLAGPGPVPLVAAPAAWMLSIIMLVLLYLWSRRKELLAS